MTGSWEGLPGTSIGFTGTRHKISSPQRALLLRFLVEMKPAVVHYGDCTGADYEMFLLCRTLGVRTVTHPPDVDTYRMWTVGDEIRPVKPYLIRNMDIVSESDYLVACPRERHEVSRSGTWMTVRYARRSDRTVVLVYPSGEVDIQRPAL